jgi:rhodanese-related sulfurtransferase
MEKSFSERVAEAKTEVSQLTPREANSYRISHPEALFIDPRNEEDILSTTGRIPGALSIPLSELSENPPGVLPPELSSRTRTIITACQGGPMGALAAHALKKCGYDNVFFIEGGTQGWLDAGYSTC